MVNKKFRRGSKTYEAARYIVRQNREIPALEREKLSEDTGLSPKSLSGLFTKLKKLKLYDPYGDLEEIFPQETVENTQEIAPHTQENLQNAQLDPQEERDSQEEYENIDEQNGRIDEQYATREDLSSLRDGVQSAINRLTSAIIGEEETEEGEYINEELVEILTPHQMTIRDPSLTRKSIWLKPKTQMYYDLTRQGLFTNYFGSNEISILNGFEGNLSDFFNSIINDYFIRNFRADIGIMGR